MLFSYLQNIIVHIFTFDLAASGWGERGKFKPPLKGVSVFKIQDFAHSSDKEPHFEKGQCIFSGIL